MQESPIRRLAPAKINLYLHLTGKRADGYHLLDSLVAFAAVGDVLEVRPARRLSVAVRGPFARSLGDVADNLVMRAARALAAAGGVSAGASLALDKRLPVAAGLGGGSSDAAAALRALGDLWRLDLGDDELARLGLGLGADVPACLAGRTVFVGGIGEEIAPAPDLPPLHVVLANPGVAAETREVYAAFAGAPSAPARFRRPPRSAAALAKALSERRNDLEAAATTIAPVVPEVLRALAGQRGCLLARMSGSGTTCFGLFAERAAAARAAAEMRAAHPAWWVEAAAVLGTGGPARRRGGEPHPRPGSEGRSE